MKRYESRRSNFEVALLIFILLLLLYTVYLCLFKESDAWGLAGILALSAACQSFFLYFRPACELTDKSLLIHEKKPLRSKEILYKDIMEYRLISRRFFGANRPGAPKDVYIIYMHGNRKRSVILSLQKADDFNEDFLKNGPKFDV